MAVAEFAIPTAPTAAERGEGRRDWRLGLTLAAVGLAAAPWVATQARVLWTEAPHYRFIPIVPVAVAALAVRGARGLGVLAPGSAAVTFALLAVSWLLSAGADAVYSPALGTVAALASLAALVQGLGGHRALRALAPAGVVLALAVRPPLRLDYELTYRLQTLATRGSSRALDLLGVYHLTSGHVLEVPGRRLFVEEACSGVTSLFVVIAVTLCAALWLRRGWFATAALLAAASAWVLLGNTARVAAVAYALARWRVDVTGGRWHEAIGLLALAAVLGLVASTDRLLALVLSPAGRAWNGLVEQAALRRQAAVAMRLALAGSSPEEIDAALGCGAPAASAAAADAPRGSTRWPEGRRTWVGSWPVVAAFAAVAVANGAAAWGGLDYSAPALSRRLAGLGAADLPDRFGALRRDSFRAEQIGARGALGSSTRRWRYRPADPAAGPGMTVEVGVDDTFVGWHDATDCYKARGWVLDSRAVVSRDGDDRVEVRMSRPGQGPAMIVFAFDDARGVPIPAPSDGGPIAVFHERLAQGWWRLLGESMRRGRAPARGPVASYLVQVLVESDRPVSVTQSAQVLTLFDRVRGDVRRRVRADGGG